MTGRVKNYWGKEKEKHQNTKSNTEMTQLQGLMIKSWWVIDLKIKTRKDGCWSATFLCECITKLMRWLCGFIDICIKYIFKNDRAFPCFFFCCSSKLQTVDGTVRLQGGAERLTLSAVKSSPARAAPALPVVGTALGSVVTVTRIETIGAPVPRGTGCARESRDTVKLIITQSSEERLHIVNTC